eukprot:COSAG06_NODE_52262_length_306_cov_6.439614_1_plen_26_part_10
MEGPASAIEQLETCLLAAALAVAAKR